LKDKPGEDKVMICTGEGSGPSNIWGQCKYRNELVVDRVNLG